MPLNNETKLTFTSFSIYVWTITIIIIIIVIIRSLTTKGIKSATNCTNLLLSFQELYLSGLLSSLVGYAARLQLINLYKKNAIVVFWLF